MAPQLVARFSIFPTTGDRMQLEVSPGIYAVVGEVRRDAFGGLGWLGGSLPAGENDGRAKIMNVPGRVQITVLEPKTFTVVARTVSRADGSWQVRYLDPARRFTVVGTDWSMGVNSAIQDWVQPHPMDD